VQHHPNLYRMRQNYATSTRQNCLPSEQASTAILSGRREARRPKTQIRIPCQDIPAGIRLEDDERGCKEALQKLGKLMEQLTDANDPRE
jgi:hypothetical protein